MLAGAALRNTQAAQAASSSPRLVDAVRSIQEQAFAELNRYADELASSPPAARAPRRMEIPTQAVEPAQPADQLLIAAADELSRQIAGLPDWCAEELVEASVGASSSPAIRT
jgi:multidrug resistance protein MdtO